MHKEITMSPLSKTWILDLDGTIVVHNGYKIYGKDVLLDGAVDFLKTIPKEDIIIFLTSRTLNCKESTEKFLVENNIRWTHIIYGAPYGERILINDRKPSGLNMAYAFNLERDIFEIPQIKVDESL